MSCVSTCVDALKRQQPKDLENSVWEINWLSLMELAFSSLFQFGPHYSPLAFLFLPASPSSSALECTVRALPPPAVSSGERFSDSKAAEDGEGGAAGAHYQGKKGQRRLSPAALFYFPVPIQTTALSLCVCLCAQDVQQFLQALQQQSPVKKEFCRRQDVLLQERVTVQVLKANLF